jgi:hypothetical protein
MRERLESQWPVLYFNATPFYAIKIKLLNFIFIRRESGNLCFSEHWRRRYTLFNDVALSTGIFQFCVCLTYSADSGARREADGFLELHAGFI